MPIRNEDDERELENGETENGPEDDEAVEGAEGEEDAADDEEAGEEDEDVLDAEAEPTRQPTRGEKRFQTLSKSAREATERAARAEQQATELRQRLERLEQRPTQQQESPEAEAARMALMTEGERLEYRLNKAQENTARTLAQMQFQQQDMSDRGEFLAKAASDPRLAKIADQVETRLADMRSKGQNVSRVALATYLFGEMALKASTSKAAQGQKKAAAKRVASQTTQPANGKGDAGATRRKGGSSLEDRLDGVQL